MTDLSLILHYTKLARTALSVVAGALDTDPLTRRVNLRVVPDTSALATTIERACAAGERVLVAWSFYSPQFPETVVELERVRRETSAADVIHLAGGPHATAEPAQTLRSGFDLVAMGEGEQVIVDLCRALLQDRPLAAIRGLAFMRAGECVRNGRGAAIDLDSFPPFSSQQRKLGPIEITRGCIYACKFCQTPFVNKARFRHRSVENVCRYARLMQSYGLRDLRFISPSALSYGSQDESVNFDAIEELLSGVREVLGPEGRIFFGTFPSEVRPEHVTPNALTLLRRYVDNDTLIIGGQSGSQRMLDASRRGHSVEAIVRAVRLSAQFGFTPNVDLLYGMPGETEDDAAATRALAQRLAKLGARIHSHTFMPLPGTPFRNAPAGRVDVLTQQQLAELTARGKAYGQWQSQQELAARLVRLREEIDPDRQR